MLQRKQAQRGMQWAGSLLLSEGRKLFLNLTGISTTCLHIDYILLGPTWGLKFDLITWSGLKDERWRWRERVWVVEYKHLSHFPLVSLSERGGVFVGPWGDLVASIFFSHEADVCVPPSVLSHSLESNFLQSVSVWPKQVNMFSFFCLCSQAPKYKEDKDCLDKGLHRIWPGFSY